MSSVYVGKRICHKSLACLTILGGLDPKVSEGDLYSAFIPFGEILAVHLPKNNLSKISIMLNVLNICFFSR